MGSLDDNSISLRTQMLRDEIRSIQEQECLYRRTNHHSSAEAMAHASRELRLVTIAAEMETLQKQRNGMKQG